MAKKAKKFNEEQELEQSYRKKAGRFEKPKPVKAKKRGNGLVIAICILIPILLLGAAACYFLMPEMGTFRDNGLILENVTIAGVNVLEERAFRGAVMDCVKAAYRRNQELGK